MGCIPCLQSGHSFPLQPTVSFHRQPRFALRQREAGCAAFPGVFLQTVTPNFRGIPGAPEEDYSLKVGTDL